MPVQTRPPVVAALTLGCKLNQAETQQAARELQRRGCLTIDRPSRADAYLINTCTITHVADRKARRLIRLAHKLAPDAPVIVTGCYAERDGDRLERSLNVQIVGNGAKSAAAQAVLDALTDAPPLKPEEASPLASSSGRTRAFLKIQEGCDDVCAFCIVPYVRGREHAVSIPEIVAQARERVAEGVREIVLTGTQPGAYGRDREDGTSAARLLEALLDQTDTPRIRYSSIQPQDITPALLACWEDARMCRHFHVALQSGSEPVLQRMRRRYTATQFEQAVERIRAAVPDASITTDIIAGFPGETDSDHTVTLELVERVRFADVHVFPYSSRPNTSASLLSDDVPPALKRDRAAQLRELGRTHTRAWRQAQVGATVSVLFETDSRGLTDTYLPVRVSDHAPRANQIAPVQIHALDDQSLELLGETA